MRVARVARSSVHSWAHISELDHELDQDERMRARERARTSVSQIAILFQLPTTTSSLNRSSQSSFRNSGHLPRVWTRYGHA